MSNYCIHIPHFYCMEYSEGERTMQIEMDFRESRLFLDVSLITNWNPPFEKEIITEQKKKEILHNVYEFLLTNFGQSKISLEI